MKTNFSPNKQSSKMMHPIWSPTGFHPHQQQQYPLNNAYNNIQQHESIINGRTATCVGGDTLSESLVELGERFNEMLLCNNNYAPIRPPYNYLCHLCFQKGHFIRDCPQVGAFFNIIISQISNNNIATITSLNTVI